jgi:uncharacterized protein (DUF2236 family)
MPRGLQSALVHAAVDILPRPVRHRLALGKEYDLSVLGRLTVKSMAAIAERTPHLNGPAAQAAERLGLPRSFVWKSESERRRLIEAAGILSTAREATA